MYHRELCTNDLLINYTDNIDVYWILKFWFILCLDYRGILNPLPLFSAIFIFVYLNVKDVFVTMLLSDNCPYSILR